MRGESDRLLELVNEIAHRVNGALRDVIPGDAQRHLLNAQRELLTALFLIYEHQAGARHREPEPRSAAGGRRRAATVRGSRVKRIEID